MCLAALAARDREARHDSEILCRSASPWEARHLPSEGESDGSECHEQQYQGRTEGLV
jgi:hypothetical protein